MKKACLLFLFPIILWNTPLKEVFKVPMLFSHYLEHKSQLKDLSVVEFLSMHYWGEDLDDNDQDEDMKLPFKKMSGNSHFQIAQPFVKTSLIKPVYSELSVSRQISQDTNLSDPSLDGLFRPPRV